MKKDIFISSFIFLVSCDSMAQNQDSIPVKSLVEKGARGDIILGKENQKNQLVATPEMLKADSSQKKEIHSKKKGAKHKKN